MAFIKIIAIFLPRAIDRDYQMLVYILQPIDRRADKLLLIFRQIKAVNLVADLGGENNNIYPSGLKAIVKPWLGTHFIYCGKIALKSKKF
ncbi:hypothetical protein [Pseudomonas sp. LFM046]|uniref:hypothetical protein n=1 Tax=Pseudomonas sp. LFM046 TaxID=1608357 RepID=UPI0011AF8393|nr:hypothetical protein [Pseudomonas sp. LFM046]